MGEEHDDAGDLDGLLDAIRDDWRRLNGASHDLERRRIRREMQRRFEELRRRLDEGPKG